MVLRNLPTSNSTVKVSNLRFLNFFQLPRNLGVSVTGASRSLCGNFLATSDHKSDANAVNTNNKGVWFSIWKEENNKVFQIHCLRKNWLALGAFLRHILKLKAISSCPSGPGFESWDSQLWRLEGDKTHLSFLRDDSWSSIAQQEMNNRITPLVR